MVGTAANGQELVDLVAAHEPDVAVGDVRMPVMDGIGATGRIAAGYSTKVLILTTFDLDEHVFDAIKSGASGFLLKDLTGQRLVEGVRLVIGVEKVKSHVTEILRKLQLRDRIHAVVFAYENGLVIRGE